MDARVLDLVGPELSRPHEHRAASRARCAPRTSPSTSSPTIQVSSGSASIASSAAREVRRARLAEHRRLDAGRVFEAGDERAASSLARARSATTGSCAGRRARPPRSSSRKARFEVQVREDAAGLLALVGAADQHGFGVHRRPARALRGRRGSPASSTRARACPRAPAQRAAGRLELVVLEPDPIARSCSPSWARDLVVELVTNRRRWPASRSRLTASAAPASGSPETCRTPSTSSRMAAMDGESIRPPPRSPRSRSGSPARAVPAVSTRRQTRPASRRSSTSRARPR